MIKSINWINIIIVLSLMALTIIFSFLAWNIRTFAIWANYQNICIEKESVNTSIPWAVRKCNGRSKVYEVK